MRPLPWVAMGLVVLLLTVSAHGYDLLADPLAWALIGYGVAHLRIEGSDRTRLLGLVALAGGVAVVLWPGPVADRLREADPSLAWAASLPQIAVAVLLCGALATLARQAGDIWAGRLLEVTRTLSVAAGVLPVVVFGGGVHSIDGLADAISVAAPALLFVLSLRYAARGWAAARVTAASEPVA